MKNNNKYNQDLFHFLKKFSLALIIPLPLLLLYLIEDPFRVIHRSYPFVINKSTYPFNRGYLSLMAYERGRESYRYDSFILGNSQCMVLDTKLWEDAVTMPGKAIQMHASQETIEGIYNKIRYIKSKGDTIRNIIIGTYCYADAPVQKTIPYRMPWQISSESPVSFHWYYFSQFLRYSLFRQNIVRHFGVEDKEAKSIFAFYVDSVDQRHNQFFSSYKPYTNMPENPGGFIEIECDFPSERIALLKAIESEIRNSNYTIVFFPRRDLKVPSQETITLFESIFSKDRVLDLSRDSVAFSYSDFYDDVHFNNETGRILTQKIISHYEH